MKDWKHLTLEQRKVISNGICQKRKLKEIAEVLGYDPTSISKEVKRNRENITIGLNSTDCKKLTRWPYVCTGCNKRYNKQCCFTKYKYDAGKAQNKADIKLVNSRKGIDVDSYEFQKLDNIVKEGIDNGELKEGNSEIIASEIFSFTCVGLIYKITTNQPINLKEMCAEFDNMIYGLLKK